jgi:hypothetical protein
MGDRSVTTVNGQRGGGVSAQTIDRVRPRWQELLLRGPGVLASPLSRVVITLVIVAGALCVIGSGVIHLYLWGKQYGYRGIPTIGPLFLLQGIVAIVVGLLAVVSRRLAVQLAAAGLMIASVIALVLAVEVGLFGFRDSWLAPYAWTTLYEEIAGGVLLLAATAALAWPGWSRRLSR